MQYGSYLVTLNRNYSQKIAVFISAQHKFRTCHGKIRIETMLETTLTELSFRLTDGVPIMSSLWGVIWLLGCSILAALPLCICFAFPWKLNHLARLSRLKHSTVWLLCLLLSICWTLFVSFVAINLPTWQLKSTVECRSFNVDVSLSLSSTQEIVIEECRSKRARHEEFREWNISSQRIGTVN